MRNIAKISVALVCLLCYSCSTSTKGSRNNSLLNLDTTNFPRQEKFQKLTDRLVKSKYITFNQQTFYSNDVLDTKQKVEGYAKNLAAIEWPGTEKYIEKYLKVSQDKTGYLCFVETYIGDPEKSFDSRVSMIFFKHDCKLVYISNYF